MEREMIIVLDFGGQYNQLIARRVRECNVYCEVHPYTIALEELKAKNPKGIIFTGGPNSVYGENSPQCNPEVYKLGIPILGLCYGAQLLAHQLGGKVETAPVSEYGSTEVELAAGTSVLFKDCAGEQTASCIIGARHADGKPVWNRITMTNVYGTDGRPFRAVGIIEDITAQREAERRFAEEEQFRAAMLSKAITSYEVNVSQNRLIRGFENEDTWFGVELTEDFEELMRRLADKAVHPEDREALPMAAC